MKKVALIGSNGQLSSDILKINDKNHYFSISPLSHSDIEITDTGKTKEVLEKINPDIVINTAAYHKVDEAEDNSDKAFSINSSAQKNLAELASEKNWISVFLSTDYVFGLDETRKNPYTENDPTSALNVYGASKIAGENFTRYINPKHFIIRVSGLHGTVGNSGKGGNFVETMIRLGKEKGEVSVVDDQILTPTYTLNIAENLLALLKTNTYGLYHMTAEGQCSWFEFTNEIFRLMKMKVKVNPVPSSQFPTRAKRPKFSVLENSNLKKIGLNKMNDWKINLKAYLQEKGYLL